MTIDDTVSVDPSLMAPAQDTRAWMQGNFNEPKEIIYAMIQDGALVPGEDKIYVNYYSQKLFSNLLPDGHMEFRGVKYTSPAQCALEMKKTINKDLKFDSGWGSCVSTDHGKSLRLVRDDWAHRKRIRISPRYFNSDSRSESNTRATKYRALSPDELDRSNRPLRIKVDDPNGTITTRARASSTSENHKDEDISAPDPSPEAQRRERALSHKKGFAKLCKVCFMDENKAKTMQCDACDRYYHIYCLEPPLTEVIDGPWFCRTCFSKQEETVRPFLCCLRDVLQSEFAVEKMPRERVELLERVENLLSSLDTDAHKMLIFAHSTGELLVHMTKMDMPKGLGTVLDQLEAIESNQAIPPLLEFESVKQNVTISPQETKTQNLVHGVDLFHRVAAGKLQIKETVAALKRRTHEVLRVSKDELTRQQKERDEEQKTRDDTQAKITQCSKEMPELKEELALHGQFLEAVSRYNTALRQLVINERLLPAYETFVAETQKCRTELVARVLGDKIEEICESLDQSLLKEKHFSKQLDALLRQTRPMAEFPTPTTERLSQRQQVFYETRLSAIRSERAPMISNLKTVLDNAVTYNVARNTVAVGEDTLGKFST